MKLIKTIAAFFILNSPILSVSSQEIDIQIVDTNLNDQSVEIGTPLSLWVETAVTSPLRNPDDFGQRIRFNRTYSIFLEWIHNGEIDRSPIRLGPGDITRHSLDIESATPEDAGQIVFRIFAEKNADDSIVLSQSASMHLMVGTQPFPLLEILRDETGLILLDFVGTLYSCDKVDGIYLTDSRCHIPVLN